MIPHNKFLLLTLSLFAALFLTSSLSAQQKSSSEGAYKVLVGEYTYFLNSVAATDTYALYNPKMGENQGGGAMITREGDPGSYKYKCDPTKVTLSVTFVPWISAVRYCNWRSHWSPVGLQDATTTEKGSYDLTAFDQGGDLSTIVLTPGATVSLPPHPFFDTLSQESSEDNDSYLASYRLGFAMTTSHNSSSNSATDSGGSSPHTGGGSSGTNPSSGDPSKNKDGTNGDGTAHAPSSGDATNRDNDPNINRNKIEISLVDVGDPNNKPDPSTALAGSAGYGSVLKPYQVGKYDVTAQEYCTFLNAVAKRSDLHQLYDINMTSDQNVACIIRSGDEQSGYTYTPIDGREQYPITHVAWASTLRFCNWLENGQPIGDQGPGTTEDGAFAMNDCTPTPGAVWSLPTDNQWYKAAYYTPSTSKTPGSYFHFGTGSNDAPGNKWEEAPLANRANYSLNHSYTKQEELRLTPVGSFTASASPWGAYDMAGEVFQWTSSTFDATKQKIIIRGGSWLSPNSDELKSTSRFAMPAGGSSIIGFRVVRNIPPQPKISPINIDLVPVVDPNNPPDKTKQKHGTVATAYQIGKYDVTAEQYCMFLNAMASHSDPHELYDPRMETDPDIACVIRYGDTNRGYSYFTIPGREKFPITYVSSFSVMRFCNWLEHHQPTAEESPEATESGSFIKNDDNKFYPVVGAKWSIPTENQWYKAAYYYPTQNRYFTYGTGTDDAPSNDLNGANSLPSANYRYLGNFTIEMQPHLTPVGTFTKSASFYGALDMSGNVSQWTLTAESEKSANLIIRGGSWNSSDENDINFSRYGALDPSSRNSTTGFRLVYNVVPPSPKPLTTWEQITHGAEVIGKEMQEDVIGFLKGEIFTKPGTYFFQTMNYTIGVGISELLAKIINNFFFILDSIFKTIGGWISWCFGDSWYGGWTTRIYDMLFSPISAVRNGAAAAEGLGGAETVVAVAAAETTGAVATAEAAALASFFASPAAAVIIPVVLFAGAYEAFLATTKSPHDDSSPDDPRISVGLALDATVRYLWTAVRLLL